MSQHILGPEWNLSPDGINIVTDNGIIKDPKTILQNALNSDLKAIGKTALTSALSKPEIQKIVLQIQKIRNISAPKVKEESQAAPRMLKITLTDGESYVQAIEIAHINGISRENTAPGTKILLKGAKIVSGYVLINSQNFSVLGGQVEQLYDKWILAKSILQNKHTALNTGAPSWVPFGSKIITGNEDSQSFKSLEKSKQESDVSEFDQQRKDAIAEASSGAIKKTFCGRMKHTVQPNQNASKPKGKSNDYEKNRRGKFESKDDEVMERPQKPSEKVSLFSFLEDKLPTNADLKVEPRNQEINKTHNNRPTTVSVPVKASYNSNHSAPQKERNSIKDNSFYRDKKTHQQTRNNWDQSVRERSFAPPSNHHKNIDRQDNQQYDKSFRKSQIAPPQNYQQQELNLHQLANDLSKISVSKEFASRSLRQHLNLAPSNKKHQEKPLAALNVGDQCMAKYWEDGKFYPAVITSMTDRTFAVQFKGYGNIEEVLKEDCTANQQNRNHYQQNNYSGTSMEFRSRRGPPRS